MTAAHGIVLYDIFTFKKLFVWVDRTVPLKGGGETKNTIKVIEKLPEFDQWCSEFLHGTMKFSRVEVDMKILDRANQRREIGLKNWIMTKGYEDRPIRRTVLEFSDLNDAILFKMRWL